MALLERLRKSPLEETAQPMTQSEQKQVEPKVKATVSQPTSTNSSYHELKEKIHRKLIDRLDLDKIDSIPKHALRAQVREVVEGMLASEKGVGFNWNRENLTEEIMNETFGLGPLEPLLNDPTISDILVNRYNQTYVERFGKLEPTNTVFKDDTHLLHIIDRIVSSVGRRIDESSPMVDARLADGSRVNAIIPPLAIDGPCLSIRKFGVKKFSAEDLIEKRSMTVSIKRLLEAAIKIRLNVLISGGTGSGKTTLLNICSSFIPSTERIVTIEDAAELQLQQEHVVRLETRPENIEGKGAVTQRDLVKNSLRMRPDRIILGEVRGGEALDMLQAMNTGHDGSLATIHANSPRDALRRLETMILMAGGNFTDKAMREQISSAIDLIVQIARLSDGSRKVMKISEVTGMEGEVIALQDIFVYEKMGVKENGKIVGVFKTTGIRPKFAEKLVTSGIRLPDNIFEPKQEFDAEDFQQ